MISQPLPFLPNFFGWRSEFLTDGGEPAYPVDKLFLQTAQFGQARSQYYKKLVRKGENRKNGYNEIIEIGIGRCHGFKNDLSIARAKGFTLLPTSSVPQGDLTGGRIGHLFAELSLLRPSGSFCAAQRVK